jgi:hypothetical protein
MIRRLLWKLKKSIRNIAARLTYLFVGDMKTQLLMTSTMACRDHIAKVLAGNPKYLDQKNLMKHGYRVCSEHNEDGIIQEIFERIGHTNSVFVEFGVGDGSMNNTLYLLLKGWKGHWIDCDTNALLEIGENYKELIDTGRLVTKKGFITAENIESLFEEMAVPHELDLLSIDIDGNDYWVWKSIRNYNPRVVVIEYNGHFRPKDKWVMAYDPQHMWDHTAYAGAALKSLEILGREKNYCLVGCDFSGTNAFFVRLDLVSDKFMEPFTAETHYEPLRYYLPPGIAFRRLGKFDII